MRTAVDNCSCTPPTLRMPIEHKRDHEVSDGHRLVVGRVLNGHAEAVEGDRNLNVRLRALVLAEHAFDSVIARPAMQ